MKKKQLIILILALSVIFTLCSCNKKETPEDIAPPETITELNVSLEELKQDMKTFILNTYMPNEEETKEDYIKSIAKYLSESEYNNLIYDIGDYDGDIETTVKELTVNYGLAENNSDNCDKVLCSFYLHKSANGVSVRNKINIVFTIQGNEITHHAVYTGNTEKRS